MNVDDYLTLADIQAALADVRLWPNWTVQAWQHRHEGVWVTITAEAMADSADPARTIDLGIDDPLPPIPDVAYLLRWLDWRLGRVWRHEVREAIVYAGARPFDPHPEPATAEWAPGDPCESCGSRETGWASGPGVRIAVCGGCGRSDEDDD